MKPGLIFFLLLIFSLTLCAQDNKGKFFVETGVKVFGGGDYQNFVGKTGISFNSTTRFWKNEYDVDPEIHSESYNRTSFSIAPRIGYYLNKKFSGGIDIQYFKSGDWEYEKYRIASGGIFFRYKFSTKKIVPFIETKTGLGTFKGESPEQTSGGGQWTQIKYENLFYYAVSGGISFELNEQFGLNLSCLGQNTIEKFSDRSNFGTDVFKISNWEVGPMISVSYIFKGKTKNQE